jgi:hypothetical protein
MTEPARAAVGSLQTEGNPVQDENAGQVAKVHGPAGLSPQAEADFASAAAAVDPLAFIGSIKSLVDVGTKVLSFMSRLPGPQQAAAQEALKLLTVLDTILSKF